MARQASLSIGTILFTILYLLVHFIPDLGGADVMGAQWLYSSALDLVVLGYIFFNNQLIQKRFKQFIATSSRWYLVL